MFSLRQKLIVGITLLIILILGTAALFFIREKEEGLVQDSFYSLSAFTDLQSAPLFDGYKQYWLQKNYAPFAAHVESAMSTLETVSNVQLYTYAGELAYDFQLDRDKPYAGESRVTKDVLLLSQIQSKGVSILTSDDRAVFVAKSPKGEFVFTEKSGAPIADFSIAEKIQRVVSARDNEYSLVLTVAYDSLISRIEDIRNRMIALALLGVLVGIAFAVFFASRITSSIGALVTGTAIIAKGDFTYRTDIHTGDELEVLGTAFNSMAAEIDKNTKNLVYQERVAKELELAARIQTGILPKKMPSLKSLDISAGIIPAEEVGGDSYDFLEVDPTKLVFYLGDVTGHGVPAGIMVSVANAVLYYLSHKMPILQTMIEANSVVKAKSANNMFMSLAMLQWDDAAKKLTYVNAGHEPLILYRAQTKGVDEVRGGGVALGMVPDNSKIIKELPVAFDVGDCLVIYSDGLPECWKDEKECFGMERLKKAVNDYANLPSALAIRNAILSEIKQFAGSYKQMDDMTILVVKRKS